MKQKQLKQMEKEKNAKRNILTPNTTYQIKVFTYERTLQATCFVCTADIERFTNSLALSRAYHLFGLIW